VHASITALGHCGAGEFVRFSGQMPIYIFIFTSVSCLREIMACQKANQYKIHF
jgi:hypothetical protein